MARHSRTRFVVVMTALSAACSNSDHAGSDATPAADTTAPVDTPAADDTGAVADTALADPELVDHDLAGEVVATPIDLRGAVQKGPFVVGSTIRVALLGAGLDPTGDLFTTQTINDRGEFAISFAAAGPVSIEGVGYYYNEVVGDLSAASLTLRAFYVPSATGTQRAYVNMITHLTTKRIQALVVAGAAFSDAVAQAERELRDGLAITPPGFTPDKAAIEMNVAGGDTDANAYLLAVSAVLVQIAIDHGGSVEANLQELLNRTANDLADGTLEAALQADVTAALGHLDTAAVKRHLEARFLEISALEAVPDLDRVIDQDRDGVVNHDDNCVHAANPGQENGDHDGRGDACDACPTTACPAECAHGTCFTACASNADCGADASGGDGADAGGASCVALAPGDTQNRVCAVTCDPLFDKVSPCGPEEGCYHLDGVGWRCLARGLLAVVGDGDPCDTGEACDAGMYCRATFGVPTCLRVCDLVTPACDGRECFPISEGDPNYVAGRGTCTPPPGQLGDACVERLWPCGAGLGCDWQTQRCVEGGGQGQPCFADGTCDGNDLACRLDASPRTCTAAGALGQPCRADGTCDVHLGCAAPDSNQMRYCVSAGGPNEPCFADGSCLMGFACIDASCIRAGGLTQACLPGGTCNDTSLTCRAPGAGERCLENRTECCL